MAAGPWLARRRLHPPTTASRMLALPAPIRQHARLPAALPSWRQDLGFEDSVSIPQPRPAGCWRSQGRSGSTHDSPQRCRLGGRTLACKTASPSPNHGQQDAGAPSADQAARTTPRSAAVLAAGPWLARRRLHPPTTASRMLALPGPIRQHARLPGALPSWRQDLGFEDSVSIPQPRPAGCWRSHVMLRSPPQRTT